MVKLKKNQEESSLEIPIFPGYQGGKCVSDEGKQSYSARRYIFLDEKEHCMSWIMEENGQGVSFDLCFSSLSFPGQTADPPEALADQGDGKGS